jgi:hypothetical protein
VGGGLKGDLSHVKGKKILEKLYIAAGTLGDTYFTEERLKIRNLGFNGNCCI